MRLGRVLVAGREMPRAVATAHCQAGLPAASVPFGSDQGLPLGLQIVAPAGGEPAVLALAARLEQLRP